MLLTLSARQKHDWFTALLSSGLIAGLIISYAPQVRPLRLLGATC